MLPKYVGDILILSVLKFFMSENIGENTAIIAVAGKGGVGKTSVAAAMVKILVETYPDKRILAIDADPAIGLSFSGRIFLRKNFILSACFATKNAV